MKIVPSLKGPTHLAAADWTALLESLLLKAVMPLLEKRGAADSTLHATLSQQKRGGNLFMASLRLSLPGKKIVVVQGQGGDPRQAATQAVERLFRETKRHFDRLSGQNQYKRKARRELLKQLKAKVDALPQAVIAEGNAGIEPLLERLGAVARRELAYLRAVGDLPMDYPTVQDVVDEAVAATRVSWVSGHDQDGVYRQLLKNLFKAIDREVAASRVYQESVPLDAPAPADAMQQAESMVEEEIYEYYQPDEELTLADVLPAEGLDPATSEPSQAEIDAASERAFAFEVFKDLPIGWRRSLLLAELDAKDTAAIAEILDTSEEAAQQWVMQANAFVHARLTDAGIIGMEMGQVSVSAVLRELR